MKRRLKEAFRLQQNDIPGHYDIWFVMRKAFDRSTSQQAIDSFQSLLSAYLSKGGDAPGGATPR